jgi:hypothetical protein
VFSGKQSAVMAWQSGEGKNTWPEFIARGCPDVSGGDQAWIDERTPHAEAWQDLYPGEIVSYKVTNKACPEKAGVVVFHGNPGPHICSDWVKDAWI